MTKKLKDWVFEALRFWELPKVECALNNLSQKWFFNDITASVKGAIDVSEDNQNVPASEPVPEPTTAIVGSYKEKA